jgi:hypothetical protein
MDSSIRLVLLLLACPLILSALQPYRTFTDALGRKIQASLISARGNQVLVQTHDGQHHVLKASMLSPADHQYMAAHGGQPASGMPPGMPEAVRRMMPGAPPPTSPPAKPSAPPTTSAASSSSNHGGMALAANWMPQRTETKRELLEGIVFYCKQVLGDTPAGQEKSPSQLSPGITWLMPFDQALAKLPGRVIKMGERPVNNNCFPANSLTISSFQFKSFQDQGKLFNLIHLLLDLKRQVVGVEFVQQTPGRTEYEIQGKLEPYYNFFNLTHNAITCKEVVYAVLNGGSSGVKCLQTVFRDYANDIGNGLPQLPGIPGAGRPGFPMVNPITPGASPQLVKVYKIVHWYLAEPFARCLLEIAQKSGVSAH